jgi:hypothetical protein
MDVPPADLARACAHDLLTSRDAAGHVKRHLDVAKDAASPDFDFKHADSHVTVMTGHLDTLVSNLKRLVPAISTEIGLLSQAMRAADTAGTPETALPRTCAHLLMTARVAAGHVRRHLDEAMAARTAASVKFNAAHARGHVAEVIEHLDKLTDGLKRCVPAVGRELYRLDQAIWAGEGQPGQERPGSAGRSVHHVGEIRQHLGELAGELARKLPAVAAETGKLDAAWAPPENVTPGRGYFSPRAETRDDYDPLHDDILGPRGGPEPC